MEDFLNILSVAVGCSDRLPAPLDDVSWERIFWLAKKQSLMGVIYDAAMRLPKDQIPPRKVKLQLALFSEKIAQKNLLQNQAVHIVADRIKSLNYDCCLLKGQAVARLYPVPTSRQCGDVDMWVNGDRKEILKNISAQWKVGRVFYHHADVQMPDVSGIEVEIHFTPSWMNDPFINKRLQRYFLSQVELQMHNYDETLSCSITTNSFDCVFSLVHIYRHLLFEGVGLRQLMDYYYILKNSSEEDRNVATKILEEFKMSRFVAASMYALQYFFKLDESFFLVPSDQKLGNFVVSEILKAGNFGQFDNRYRIPQGATIFERFTRRMRRLITFFNIAPSEVFWAPAFKIWQYFWRIANKY